MLLGFGDDQCRRLPIQTALWEKFRSSHANKSAIKISGRSRADQPKKLHSVDVVSEHFANIRTSNKQSKESFKSR